MRIVKIAGALAMCGWMAAGCGGPIEDSGEDVIVDVDQRPVESDVTPEEAAELDSKADSDAGPGIKVTWPAPDDGDLVIAPTTITCQMKVNAGYNVYFKCPAISLTVDVTDKGRGIDWDSTVLYGKKYGAFGITLKKIDIPVRESWKNRAAKRVEVTNYPMDDCRNISIVNACKFTAFMEIKDKPASGSQRKSVKSYDVELDMSAYPKKFTDPDKSVTCPAPAGAKYWCN